MADFCACKLIGSTTFLNSAFSFPLNLCSHIDNFSFLRLSPSSSSPRRRPTQYLQFLAHSASPFSSLALRTDIISTTERSDGTLLFEFGDPNEIIDSKRNSDSESHISEEVDSESEEVTSFQSTVVDEETSGSDGTKQGQTVETILDRTEDADSKETAPIVKEESFSVGKVNEVCGEPICKDLSSEGETVTSFIDERILDEEDKQTLSGAAFKESNKTLTSIVDEEKEETLTISAEREHKKTPTSLADQKGNNIRTSILDEENGRNLKPSVEEVVRQSPQARAILESKKTVTDIVDEEDKETPILSAEDQRKKSHSTSVVDEERKIMPTTVVDEENKETLTTSFEEELKNLPMGDVDEDSKSNLTSIIHEDNKGILTTSADEEQKKSPKSLLEEESIKTQLSIVDDEKTETLMSSIDEEKKESITSIVENTNDLPEDDYYREAEALTMTFGTDKSLDINARESHVQDVEEMKIIETKSSALSHEHELHVEGCDVRAEIQEMDVNTLNGVALDALAPIDTAEVAGSKNEIKTDNASMELILNEEQQDQMSDDLVSMEEAQSSILVDDGASGKSSDKDRFTGDGAISCITKEEDQQLLDTGLIDTVDRDEKLCPTLVLAAGVASLRLPSKALTGEVDTYFVAGENWFGVADGVAQWSLQGTKDGFYAQELLQKCETLVCNSSTVEVSEVGDAFRQSAASVKSPGLASVLIAYFDNKYLHVANVGDTGYMVIRNGLVLQRSSPMVHEVSLPVLIGTFDDPVDVIEEYQVEIEDGDVIIAATDGLFDNLYGHDIVSIISKSLEANMTNTEIAEVLAEKAQLVGMSMSSRSPFADAVQEAGYAGYAGGKPDHVTVIVSLVREP